MGRSSLRTGKPSTRWVRGVKEHPNGEGLSIRSYGFRSNRSIKERIKRESLFSYDSVHTREDRPKEGELREEVLLRDGPICAWCKKEFNPFEVQLDHIKPRARFKNPEDADHIDNMQVLCTEHHRAKTKTDLKVLSRVR